MLILLQRRPGVCAKTARSSGGTRVADVVHIATTGVGGAAFLANTGAALEE